MTYEMVFGKGFKSEKVRMAYKILEKETIQMNL